VSASGQDTVNGRKRSGRFLGRSVRYKLLVLALFPVALALPTALALAIYWGGHFGYEQLLLKVSTDLAVADDVFKRAQQDYLSTLARVAESYRFRTDLQRDDVASLERELTRVRKQRGFAFLHLVDRQGRWLVTHGTAGSARPSPLIERALLGEPSTAIEVFSADDLAQEDPNLAEQVRLPLRPTPHAAPTGRQAEDRAMVIRSVQPVRDANGNVRWALDGGVVLNSNFAFVDAIRDLVYGPGSLPKGSIGTVTLFLDDVRISTNVPLSPGGRALGTRVSQEVRRHVLGRGEKWINRAFVVNDWYISAYEPILDVTGNRVGMLYTGFLEAPFRLELVEAATTLVILLLALAAVTGWVATAGAKRIFQPLERMSAVARATRAGEDRRIGPVEAQDEIGQLARDFDAMLNLLKQRNDEIRTAAEFLEIKVEERTAELKQRNAELERTVRLLRETRRQLVNAEKLAALGELTAGMAHEINNPMAVILGNMDVLAQELGSAAEPVQAEIELVIEQVYRVRDIIDSLLRYARPGDRAGPLEALDVNELVRDTLKLVSHLLRRTDIEVRLDLQASEPVRIARQDLEQVMVNLLVNAAHALDGETGQIDVTSRNWQDRGVVIVVRDTGRGIPADVMERLFTPFFSTKDVGQGTGLGLSVTYGLIRRYGGTITVESKEGEGAEFHVWLLSEPQPAADDTDLAERLRLATVEPLPEEATAYPAKAGLDSVTPAPRPAAPSR
jgi:two-component system NtrC family sensor kinase